MAQTILDLIANNSIANGVYLSIKETVNGVEANVPYRIHGHNLHENSEDSVMLVRKYAPVTHRMHSKNTTIYEDCEMDTWLNKTWAARYSAEMLACMLTSNILILDANNEAYSIARKFFIPSYSEWGFSATVPDGIASPYTTSSSKRIVYNESGTAVKCWLRTRYSDIYYWCITSTGMDGYSATNSSFWALPAFDLPSSLTVADLPNDDGTYSLIVPGADLPGIDVAIRADESDSRYTAIKVSVAIKGDQARHLQVCNNLNDDTPTWEDASFDLAHTFMNSAKTADRWALGVRMTASGEQIVVMDEPFIMWTKK